MTDQIDGNDGASFANPRKKWPNDDILLEASAQHLVAEVYPRAFRVLDWEEHRNAFKKYDIQANQAKRDINRYGVTGALLSTVGTSLLVFAPLWSMILVQQCFAVIGGLSVLIGVFVGLWHLSRHSGKSRWLVARMWTERLRQFYFQYIINNLGAAVAAMGDDNKLAEYRSKRMVTLKVFMDDMTKQIEAQGGSGCVRWLSLDHKNAHIWAVSHWMANHIDPDTPMSDDCRELFECLSRNRITIQENYARTNLKEEGGSQWNKAVLFDKLINFATLAFVLTVTAAGFFILLGGENFKIASDILIAISGVAAAWGLYFRLVDQGVGYSQDTERYKIYLKQVELVRDRFDASQDVHGKTSALRLLEVYAYHEMRHFLHTHQLSRFLG